MQRKAERKFHQILAVEAAEAAEVAVLVAFQEQVVSSKECQKGGEEK